MFEDFKMIVTRSGDTLMQDFSGAAALILMLVVVLHVPALG